MFESLKKIKDLYIQAKNMDVARFDEEGLELIPMHVIDDSNFLSAYSSKDEEIISSEAAEYLEHKIKPSDISNKLHISISSSCIDEEEEKRYAKAIKNYYKNKVIDETRKIHINSIQSLSMIIVGILILTIYIVLEFVYKNPLLEVIDIAAWVFVWEAVNLYFIERRVMRFDQIKYAKLFEAKVSFEKE